jgi:peptidoglycan/LPS O-acetylase OafA/YrhL
MALPRNGLWRDSTLVGTIGYTLLDFGFAALLLLSVTPVKNNSLAKVVANRPLRFLGKYSYGLYVFHMPITFLLSKNGVTAYSLARGIGAPLLGRVCFIALAMILSIVVALVSWHVWEKHFLKLKARFAYAPRQIRAELA